ncbi:muconate cycloisomerase (plasmid) [Rhodococcus opacus]|uniref:Muconate cycloisomerase n=2 Tax=Rhodococcus opacus TaxID=37919 RepID=O67985_RHOOP|nr:chloromuconate cycloisomerase [Rhodococcus opacus]ANS32248.1 Chlormuconate cycloisomerase ClcB [Rhodococcus opacus]ANS32342.1 muconate cycloisomerase [Rhodococcus opacus]
MPNLTVSGVRTTIVDLPILRPHRFANHSIDAQTYLLVEVVTDAGFVGLGEGVSPGGPWWGGESIEGQKQIIDCYLAPALIGSDVEDLAGTRRQLDRIAFANLFAKAALETALLDAIGQAHNVALSTLLGGATRTELPLRWPLSGAGTGGTLEEAAERVAAGYRRIKFKMGALAPREDIDRVGELVDKIGDGVDYLGDPNGTWDLRTATWAVRELEAIGLSAVEQPVERRDVRGLAELRSRADRIDIMADESVCVPADALEVVRERACDSVAVKPGKAGGLRAAALIAAILDTASIGPYGGTALESPVGTAASAHLFATFPRLLHGCELVGPLLLADSVITEPLAYTDGILTVPTGPGLGVRLDHDKVDRYRRR